uniref:Uncharacterized protein n=1 Tax=Oryza sativa subsp. japonica TaxID=39947 RepID=Q67IU0_ORYSJ|nr:hypothetical protein [Oryza sativa Japonica Group]
MGTKITPKIYKEPETNHCGVKSNEQKEKKSADESTDPGSGELDAASPAQTSGGIKRLCHRRRRCRRAAAFAGAGVESPGDSSRGVKEERRERRWPKPLGQPGPLIGPITAYTN